jgi:hypothetical protein
MDQWNLKYEILYQHKLQIFIQIMYEILSVHKKKKNTNNVTIRNFGVITEKFTKRHNMDSTKGYLRSVWSLLFYWYIKQM